jgi:hypothetical protein
MMVLKHFQISRTIPFLMAVCFVALPAQARYSGGTGEPNDPYQIATAGDLIALGETPPDYDKHFILTADIDLDPNLPGRKVFDEAVIAPATDLNDWTFSGVPIFSGTSFSGVFDGKGHVISHLTITGGSYLGLFGAFSCYYVGEIRNLGLVDVNIFGSGSLLGGLVGFAYNSASVRQCSSTGTVSGVNYVGGLVGGNGSGTIAECYSTCAVSGRDYVGGLVGLNAGRVRQCYSTGAVSGYGNCVGGLVGSNAYFAAVSQCYSTGAVSGVDDVGGLVGGNGPDGTVNQCYSTGAVSGTGNHVGGLAGGENDGSTLLSVWDTETSGLSGSAGGVGLTTAEMMNPYILGVNGFANERNWVLDGDRDYPRLAWQGTLGQIIPEPDIGWLEGSGLAQDPYQIVTADQVVLLGKASILWGGHFVLGADIDLDPNLPNVPVFAQAVVPDFMGVFDGDGHIISHLTITGGSRLGLFGKLRSGAEVKNLGLVDVDVTGSGDYVGGLVAENWGGIVQCHSTGAVDGNDCVGGLVGTNEAAPWAEDWSPGGAISQCYSTCVVRGTNDVGGLVGLNSEATVTQGYSTGTVSGTTANVGGLVGYNYDGTVTASVWDSETSGQAMSAGGTGKTTAEMQAAQTFLDAGWDFVGETANGTENIWWISDGKDYPRLWWEGDGTSP